MAKKVRRGRRMDMMPLVLAGGAAILGWAWLSKPKPPVEPPPPPPVVPPVAPPEPGDVYPEGVVLRVDGKEIPT